MLNLITGLLWFAVLSYLFVGVCVASFDHQDWVESCGLLGRGRPDDKSHPAYWIALDVVVWVVGAFLWPLLIRFS